MNTAKCKQALKLSADRTYTWLWNKRVRVCVLVADGQLSFKRHIEHTAWLFYSSDREVK